VTLTPHNLLAALESKLPPNEVERLLKQLRELPPNERLDILGRSRVWIQGRDNIVRNNNIVILSPVIEREVRKLLEPIENEATKFLNSLKRRYSARYEQKLDGRFEMTLKVDRIDVRQTAQGMPGCSDKQVDASQAITDSFEKEGRLLIVGSPGAGKTVLLIKLALSLFSKVGAVPIEPIPVIFNLATWSPKYVTFEDWLIEMLVSANGLSRDFARLLLRQGRISFFLDGLDELGCGEPTDTAAELRAACLSSLNAYLVRGRKVVLCCRYQEFLLMTEQTNQGAPVTATVMVRDLTQEQVRAALTHILNKKSTGRTDQVAASNILDLLGKDEDGVLIDVLRKPFYFTTALEVFDRQILSEPRGLGQVKELEQYLLCEYVGRKLYGASGPIAFGRDRTLRWLKWLARFLADKRIVTFELADLQPNALVRQWLYHAVSGLIVICVLAVAGWGTFAGLLIKIFPGRKGNRRYLFVLRKWEFWRNVIATTTVLSVLFGALLGAFFGIAVYFADSSTSPFLTSLIAWSWGVIIGVIPAGAVGIGTNLLTADIKTEDQIRLNLSALRYLRTWIQALKFGVLIGALIAGAIFLIGFILSIPSAYTITADSQQGDHVTAVWVLIVVYAIAFASIPGALGLLLGAVSVLVSSCRIVEFFVQLEHGHQRLRAGLVSNSLKFGILNVVLSSIPNLFVITS
jgi:NACHT domain